MPGTEVVVRVKGDRFKGRPAVIETVMAPGVFRIRIEGQLWTYRAHELEVTA